MEALKLGIDYEKLQDEYLDLLKKYNITLNIIINEEEFEEYLLAHVS